MANFRLFLISLLLTTSALVAIIYFNRSEPPIVPHLVPVADDLFVTSQLNRSSLRYLRRQHIRTIVDMRPDGEAKDQASSSEIESASGSYDIEFHYIPVPHEAIPDKAVTDLDEILSHRTEPAVLYCRTGRRAVRLFALVEASRKDGPNSDAILKMVRAAGFSADDLKENIAQRISRRSAISTEETQ
jgi:uncharacterized protein (TIGR01244 family)